MRYLLSLLLIISAVFCFTLAAATYTLPNGKVLEDPYVMSQRPDGLEIGHNKGITFVKFTDLPEKARKKYNYDPAKVAEYEAQQQEYKEKLKVEQKNKDMEEASARAENQKIMLNWEVKQLDVEIQKTEVRINFLKGEIPRLDKEYETCMNKSTELAGKQVSSNSSGNNYSYGWNGGFITTGGGSTTAESTKKRTVSKLGDDASNAKSKADSYRKELETKQNDLILMKRNYADLKDKPIL
jgi:predicted  nucleic acid-binding Zn-ribbon protein